MHSHWQHEYAPWIFIIFIKSRLISNYLERALLCLFSNVNGMYESDMDNV